MLKYKMLKELRKEIEILMNKIAETLDLVYIYIYIVNFNFIKKIYKHKTTILYVYL